MSLSLHSVESDYNEQRYDFQLKLRLSDLRVEGQYARGGDRFASGAAHV